MGTLIAVVVAVSAVWVYWDATGHKIGRVPEPGDTFDGSAGMWAAVTLLLWVVGFPAYLVKRGKLIERAKMHPVEVEGRVAKTVATAAVGVIFAWLSM